MTALAPLALIGGVGTIGGIALMNVAANLTLRRAGFAVSALGVILIGLCGAIGSLA